MTARADILGGVQDAISQLAEGETWQRRPLTSEPGVIPATFGASETLVARLSAKTRGQEFDQDRGGWVSVFRATISTSTTTDLLQGDVVRDGNGEDWAVEGMTVEGIGHRLWTIRRDLPGIQGRTGESAQ